MSRKVDPIHFFDHLGNSLLTMQHVLEENRRLAAENQALKARLGKAEGLLQKVRDKLQARKAN